MYYTDPYNNYYYYNTRGINSNRYGIGGFLVPFGLGFLTGPLVVNQRPRPIYNQAPYYPYYPYNYPYNYPYYRKNVKF